MSEASRESMALSPFTFALSHCSCEKLCEPPVDNRAYSLRTIEASRESTVPSSFTSPRSSDGTVVVVVVEVVVVVVVSVGADDVVVVVVVVVVVELVDVVVVDEVEVDVVVVVVVVVVVLVVVVVVVDCGGVTVPLPLTVILPNISMGVHDFPETSIDSR